MKVRRLALIALATLHINLVAYIEEYLASTAAGFAYGILITANTGVAIKSIASIPIAYDIYYNERQEPAVRCFTFGFMVSSSFVSTFHVLSTRVRRPQN